MTRPNRIRSAPVALAGAAALAALASLTPSPAAAQDYDMDCAVILCLPAGFAAEGCGAAHDHMMDRIRDGKSPIGVCPMGGGAQGAAYEDYDLDMRPFRATSPKAWRCPEGKTLHHEVAEQNGRDDRRRIVTAFCYADRGRLGPDGYYYTDKSTPARIDMEMAMTLAPGTEQAYASDPFRFRSGLVRDNYTIIRHDED